MAIKILTIKVHRSEVTEIPTTIRAWELPILEAMHQTVEVIDEVPYTLIIRNVEDEYQRLQTVYGRTTNEDGSRGLPYVAAVYGQFQLGRQKLAEAIKAATVDEPSAPKGPVPYSNLPSADGQPTDGTPTGPAPAEATDLLGATA